MNKRTQDIFVSGLALFAIFFGAGNLIFPPYLGVTTGDGWFATMCGFLLADPVIPILTVFITAFAGGRAVDLGKRVSPGFAKLLSLVAIICIGPAFAIPRTAATTHEVGVMPFFPNAPAFITSIVFFGITFALAYKENGVVDIIGKYITPALLIFLVLIIAKAIITPVGAIVPVEHDGGFFVSGFYEGYQTLDALAAPLFTGIVVADLIRKGYGEVSEKERRSFIMMVGLVAFVALAVVYGGLTYLGAQGSSMFTADDSRVEILVALVGMLFGNFGKIALGLAVALACLTTSVGLTSAAGNFFEDISNGKIKYGVTVVVVTVISFALSLIGVDAIIALAGPVLTIVYPIIIALVFYMMFEKRVRYDMAYIVMVAGVLVIAIIETVGDKIGLGGMAASIQNLPLGQFGFTWFVPSLVCFAVGYLIGKMGVGKTIDDHPDTGGF
ncbi:branched-chain amino acid transport system II carrier protein [Aedoeadaptatus acetigenes]|uniref:branched-chain amino acid transport system II carrier protein n=1 Tax=Aedoeadaptatus acetigenes TaxID=2981723 RepID=UPI0011DE319C|nr:branched-chain amino acid transport system II carrier protein [Aedoeadaptatus acetigenes]MCU6785903.1 branched-chain amino acid transport system II carrier protein [Aedoeadaptatus acetigenes]